MRRAAAFLAALCSMGAAAQGVEAQIETYVAEFDWLSAANGRDEFAEGLLTLNQEDLERFVPTGEMRQRYSFGPVVIEGRAGVYYSNEDFKDTSLDEPASVLVRHNDRILAGAKGLFLDLDVAGNYLRIQHWNGEQGCTLSRWYLEIEFIDSQLNPDLRVVDAEYADSETEERCDPEQ